MDNLHGYPLAPEAAAEQETVRIELIRKGLVVFAEQKNQIQ